MIITANTCECKNAFPNIFTYITTISEGGDSSNKTNTSCSGVVILVIIILPHIINDTKYDGAWVNGLYNEVRSCKPNTLDSYDHYGSRGAWFSFGNKPFYGIINHSSVGIYTNLKRKKAANK